MPPNWQKELFSIKTKCGKRIADVRWVPANNMHVTVKFLGSCEDNLPEKILSVLSSALSNFNSFHFKLGMLGGFPALKRARVFWMGMAEGGDTMRELASLVEEALVPLGFKKEDRDFHPHVTLARLKKPFDLTEIAAGQDLENLKKSLIKVKYLTLFKSTLTPKGAIYDVLAEIPLYSG